MKEVEKLCGYDQCGLDAEKFCSKCKLVPYCSREHQVADWKNHKKICQSNDPIDLITKMDQNINISQDNRKVNSSKRVEQIENSCGYKQCYKVSKSFCSKCKKVHYCSRQHQVADWKHHKQTCQSIDIDDEEVNCNSEEAKKLRNCGYDQCELEAEKFCSKCKLVRYCSREHQIADWKNHRKSCQASSTKHEVITDPLQGVESIWKGKRVPPDEIIREVKDLSQDGIPLRMVELKDKGIGLIATRNIKSGELVFQEKPILKSNLCGGSRKLNLTVDEEQKVGKEVEELLERVGCESDSFLTGQKSTTIAQFKRVMSGYKVLPDAEKVKYMQLHDSFLADTDQPKSVCGIYATNAVQEGDNSNEGVVCMLVSRINHSCVPNVQHVWTEPFERVVSNRDIQCGEEILTNYVRLDAGKLQRGLKLTRQYGFICNCEACSLIPLSKQAMMQQFSDQRRYEIRNLDDNIVQLCHFDPMKALQSVEKLLELQRKEGIQSHRMIARASYDAYQIAVSVGDLSLATMWIERAHSNYTISDGAESNVVKKLSRYLRNPKLHPSWGGAY